MDYYTDGFRTVLWRHMVSAPSNCPPDIWILVFESSNLSSTTKKTSSYELVFFVVGEDGFEPSKRNAADLQSVPFGHSGTPPDM